MPFKEVPSKVDFPAQEHDILAFWDQTEAFEKLRRLHQDDPKWSFIDGPITANNPMGVHHGWGRTYKDLFQRFHAMRGHKLRYQNGFDCQGLWVEVEVEKEMGFQTKKDIEAYGLEQFVRKCKARVLRFAAVQTEQSIRLGYWMDWNDTENLRWLADQLMEDPSQVITVDGPDGPITDSVEMIVGRLGLPELGGSYFTFSNENNYMIWKFLKTLLGKRLVVPRRRRDALVPALRHRHQPARDRHRRLRRADPPQRHPALPLARPGERVPAGLDHHPLDPEQQRRRRRRTGADLRKGSTGRPDFIPLQRHAGHAAGRL